MTRKLTTLGARGLLRLLGGVATFVATACPAAYGPWLDPADATLSGADAAYGPPIGLDATLLGADAAYGPRVCSTDNDCTDVGSQWYCGPNGWCEYGTRPDAGETDGGQ